MKEFLKYFNTQWYGGLDDFSEQDFDITIQVFESVAEKASKAYRDPGYKPPKPKPAAAARPSTASGTRRTAGYREKESRLGARRQYGTGHLSYAKSLEQEYEETARPSSA